MTVFAILSRSSAVVPKIVAATSARLMVGPALVTYSTNALRYHPQSDATTTVVKTEYFVSQNALNENQPYTRPVEATKKAVMEQPVTKSSVKPINKEPDISTTVVKTEYFMLKNDLVTDTTTTDDKENPQGLTGDHAFDVNADLDKASKLAERAKPFHPAGESFQKGRVMVERSLDAKEKLTKTRRLEVKAAKKTA